MVDHVNEIEAAFLHLLNKGPVQCFCPSKKIDTAKDALVRNLSQYSNVIVSCALDEHEEDFSGHG